MNRRAAEERLRLEGVATPDITSAARYATLPKMGTRDASRAGQRYCPRLTPMGTRVVVYGPGSPDGRDVARFERRLWLRTAATLIARRDASLLIIAVIVGLLSSPLHLLSSFVFILVYALSWKSPRNGRHLLIWTLTRVADTTAVAAVICSSSAAAREIIYFKSYI